MEASVIYKTETVSDSEIKLVWLTTGHALWLNPENLAKLVGVVRAHPTNWQEVILANPLLVGHGTNLWNPWNYF